MLLTYFLNDIEIVPVAPIITGITFVFTFHIIIIIIIIIIISLRITCEVVTNAICIFTSPLNHALRCGA